MDFSDTNSFEKYLKEISKYRINYLDIIIDKYVNTDKPDTLINMQTLEVVGNEGKPELCVPGFGTLNEYYCKPAQYLIKENMKLLNQEYPEQESSKQKWPVRQKKLSKYDYKKVTHVSIIHSKENRREETCLLKKRNKRKSHLTPELDTSLQLLKQNNRKSKNHRVCSPCDLTDILHKYQTIPIDKCSLSTSFSKMSKFNEPEPRSEIKSYTSKSTISHHTTYHNEVINCNSENSNSFKEVECKARSALRPVTYHNKAINCNSDKRVKMLKSSFLSSNNEPSQDNKAGASSMPVINSIFSEEKLENNLYVLLKSKSQKDKSFTNETICTCHQNSGKKLDFENKQTIKKRIPSTQTLYVCLDRLKL